MSGAGFRLGKGSALTGEARLPLVRSSLAFFVRAARNDPQHVGRQRALQGLRLVPWGAHPYVTLLTRGQYHRHRFGWMGSTTALGDVVRIHKRRAARGWAGISCRARP
jgi:hypothetical protein